MLFHYYHLDWDFQHRVKGVRLVEVDAVQIASQTANITVQTKCYEIQDILEI